jgi:hypothetical protein
VHYFAGRPKEVCGDGAAVIPSGSGGRCDEQRPVRRQLLHRGISMGLDVLSGPDCHLFGVDEPTAHHQLPAQRTLQGHGEKCVIATGSEVHGTPHRYEGRVGLKEVGQGACGSSMSDTCHLPHQSLPAAAGRDPGAEPR